VCDACLQSAYGLALLISASIKIWKVALQGGFTATLSNICDCSGLLLMRYVESIVVLLHQLFALQTLSALMSCGAALLSL
jgi:hypothetical protein